MIQFLQSDPSLKSKEITAQTQEALASAKQTRDSDELLPPNRKDAIRRYKEEFEKPERYRSKFFLEHEKKTYSTADVPLVQIPDSAIYQVTHLFGNEDNSACIDTIHYSTNLNHGELSSLVSQLEKKTTAIADIRTELKSYQRDIEDLQAKSQSLNSKLTQLQDDRDLLQSRLIVVQNQAIMHLSAAPPKTLTGDEIMSNFMSNEINDY